MRSKVEKKGDKKDTYKKPQPEQPNNPRSPKKNRRVSKMEE